MLAAFGVLIGAGFDDGAGDGVAGQLQICKADMVGSPVQAINDDLGRALQLVMQAAFGNAPQNRIGRRTSMKRKA